MTEKHTISDPAKILAVIRDMATDLGRENGPGVMILGLKDGTPHFLSRFTEEILSEPMAIVPFIATQMIPEGVDGVIISVHAHQPLEQLMVRLGRKTHNLGEIFTHLDVEVYDVLFSGTDLFTGISEDGEIPDEVEATEWQKQWVFHPISEVPAPKKAADDAE